MSTISHLDPNETVVNLNDHMLPFAAACVMMDDDLREELAMEGGFETNQDWFTNYENRHIEKFGEIWELSKANPTWWFYEAFTSKLDGTAASVIIDNRYKINAQATEKMVDQAKRQLAMK